MKLSHVLLLVASIQLVACDNSHIAAATKAAKAADEAKAVADAAAAPPAVPPAAESTAPLAGDAVADSVVARTDKQSDSGNGLGSHRFCADLASIGEKVFAAKQDGHSMGSVLLSSLTGSATTG